MNTSVDGRQIIAIAKFLSKDNENINKINRILQPVYLEIFNNITGTDEHQESTV